MPRSHVARQSRVKVADKRRSYALLRDSGLSRHGNGAGFTLACVPERATVNLLYTDLIMVVWTLERDSRARKVPPEARIYRGCNERRDRYR